MTSNMISFRKYEEDVRHNREMERLTGEQQAEAVRHNKAVEEETVRTNVRNEQIKQQQNVINDNHYQRSDFETARSHGITELYTLQYPYSYGQTQANVAKTQSEASLNSAKARESRAKAEESQSKTLLNQSQIDVNKAKRLELLGQLIIQDSQVRNIEANTRLTNTRNKYYPSESVVNSINKGSQALGNVLKAITIIGGN